MPRKKTQGKSVKRKSGGATEQRGVGREVARTRVSELAQNLERYLAAHHHVSPGQRIGVAVSGGADSVALLQLLLELRGQLGVVLSAVHFNHKLRGKASESDEKFVRELAEQHDLPFFAAHEDIAAKVRQTKGNVEETARRSRYAFFDRLVAEGNIDRIAVAHTADDQAETVLSHILRGTGIAGLGGIHPEAGCVFRPLLGMRRAELRAYLRSRKQRWREDATNRDVTRTRARIRHKLLPLLERQFQPTVVEHLCQLAELAREDDAWMESSAELRVFLSAKAERDGWRVPIRELVAGEKSEPIAAAGDNARERPASEGGPYKRRGTEAMSKRMIRLLVKRVKPRAGQLSAIHVEAVMRLAQQKHSGKVVQLPGGVEVRRERDWLWFRARREVKEGSSAFSYPVDLSAGRAELCVVEHSCVLRFQVIDWPGEGRETKETGAVLDRDKLRVPLVVRNWRPGDAVQAVGHQKSHTLSRLLNEVGVSRWEKESWPVLTSGGKIAWSRGLPVAEEFAAGGSTRAGVVISEVPLS